MEISKSLYACRIISTCGHFIKYIDSGYDTILFLLKQNDAPQDLRAMFSEKRSSMTSDNNSFVELNGS